MPYSFCVTQSITKQKCCHFFTYLAIIHFACKSVIQAKNSCSGHTTDTTALTLTFIIPWPSPSAECCNAETEDCCHAGTPEQALVIIVDSGGLARPDPGPRYTWPSADSGTHLLADNLPLHHHCTAGDKYRGGQIIIVHCISTCTDGKFKISLHYYLLQAGCCSAVLHGEMYHWLHDCVVTLMVTCYCVANMGLVRVGAG